MAAVGKKPVGRPPKYPRLDPTSLANDTNNIKNNKSTAPSSINENTGKNVGVRRRMSIDSTQTDTPAPPFRQKPISTSSKQSWHIKLFQFRLFANWFRRTRWGNGQCRC